MLGFNKKAGHVIWRNSRFNRVAVIAIETSPPEYAVAIIDSQASGLRAEFNLDCVHGIDFSRQETVPCKVLAMSKSKDAMLLVAQEIATCFDTTMGVYRD